MNPRATIHIALCVILGITCIATGSWKIIADPEPNGWIPAQLLYASAMIEIAIGLGAPMHRTRWPLWLGLANGIAILMLNVAHIGDPRPCGCLGNSVTLSLQARMQYGAWMAAACCIALALSPGRNQR